MARSFLESTFLTACPSFRSSWESMRRGYEPGTEPDASAFLGALRFHVVGLAAVGRVAEFTRFAQTLDRLLVEADPILEDLLTEELVAPLAIAVRDGQLAAESVEPHLGVRARAAWRRRVG
ncbi:MAG: hypothetical protein ABR499_16745 [Gemmatimonadaceae bacterium]